MWTTFVREDTVRADLGAARASWDASEGIAMWDFTRHENSLLCYSGPDGTPTPERCVLPRIDGLVRFSLEMSDVVASYDLDDPLQRYRGSFVEGQARVECSAETQAFRFVSDALETSSSLFSQLGWQANGEYY